ncbi:hypothetical protein [Methylobrevis pamukkalensis]|uniref:hypothetical protein n=1 Tax=Methylobrevis pamukkalensis TaxID=1439726 RepID=UPI003159E2AF
MTADEQPVVQFAAELRPSTASVSGRSNIRRRRSAVSAISASVGSTRTGWAASNGAGPI